MKVTIPEVAQSLEQLAMALGVRRERTGADESAERVQGCCDVDVEMGVDAPIPGGASTGV